MMITQNFVTTDSKANLITILPIVSTVIKTVQKLCFEGHFNYSAIF